MDSRVVRRDQGHPQRTRAFGERVRAALEADRTNYDDHENIRLDLLAGGATRAKRKAYGAAGAEGLRRHGAADRRWAAMYEEANRSIFGPGRSIARRPTTAT